MDYSNIKKPAEKDTRKITIILGSIKLDTDTETIEVPEEILKVMSKDKEKAIAEAFTEKIERKTGNRITIICKTRKDALLLAKWNGIQNSGTYTQNPLPACFTDLTWNTTEE